MKDSGVAWIGEIPKNWGVAKIKNFVAIKNGKEVLSSEGDIPVYGSGGVFGKTNNIMAYGESVLMGRKGTIDKPKYISEGSPFWCVDTVFYTSKKPICHMMYFYYCVSSIDYNEHIYGTALPSMTQTILNNINMPFPTLTEQQTIANYLDEKCAEIENLISLLEEMIGELKAYKQSVITEAVCKGLNKNAPMKDSGIEWIGEIPEHWTCTRLKLITLQIGDGLHGTPNYDDNGEYYFINGNNLGDDAIDLHIATRQINEYEYKKYKIELNSNSILISLNGTIGNLSFYNGEPVILSKSSGYINLKDTENKYYIKYVLMSDNCKRYFDNSFSGTTINNLSLNTLRNTYITFPPLSEQQTIANYLDEKCGNIEGLIAIKQAKIDELKEFKKSLIYEYVTGKKSVI